MGVKTTIGWTDSTWSPLRVLVREDAAKIAEEKGYRSLIQIAEKNAGHIGHHCEKVSEECDECYSMHMQARCLPYNGTGLPFDRRSRDLVEPFVDEKELLKPLSWRVSKRIFVQNQDDIFGDWYTDEMIDRVFASMALCYDMRWTKRTGQINKAKHVFQVLTKRPERMRQYVNRIRTEVSAFDAKESDWFALPLVKRAIETSRMNGDLLPGNASIPVVQWIADGMPGLWLGVSAGTQKAADERLPILMETPAAVRFVSLEPLLEPVDLTCWMPKGVMRDVERKGISGVSGDWSVLDRREWSDLEAQEADCREQDRIAAILGGDKHQESRDIDQRRIPNGAFFGRSAPEESVCSSGRLDGGEAGGYTTGNASQPQGRYSLKHQSGELGANHSIRQCDTRDSNIGEETSRSIRRGEQQSEIDRMRCARDPESMRIKGNGPNGNSEDFQRLAGDDILHTSAEKLAKPAISWVIVGGESQSGARPFDIDWAAKTVLDCEEFGTACFVKQLGARPMASRTGIPAFSDFPNNPPQQYDPKTNRWRIFLQDKKHGADPQEWPSGLQVQNFPNEVR